MHRALYLAAHAGVRIQIVHVSSPVSAAARRARRSARGRPVTMEICPHHLLLDLDDLVRLGPYGVCAPALRDRALVERLWDFVLDGTARLPRLRPLPPRPYEEKDAGLGRHLRRAARLPGYAGDDAARARRGLPPPRLRSMRSPASRRRTRRGSSGSYPRKGSLLPGSDADLSSTTSRPSGRWTPARSSSPRTRGRRSTGGACGRAWCARSCAARRCTRRRDPRRAGRRAASSPATTSTPLGGAARPATAG